MNSFLNKDGLIHFSKKIKEYINKKTDKLGIDISTLDTKVESDKLELKTQIDENNISLDTRITDEINTTNNKIQAVDTRVDGLKTVVDNIDYTPMNGDTINVNKVEQYVFHNIKAGDVIEIPNTTKATDFMIECYTDVGDTPEIQHSIIDINDNSKTMFTYDDRFIEFTSTGVKPKDTISLNYTKTDEVIDGITYSYYISDVIPEELLLNLNSIIAIEES